MNGKLAASLCTMALAMGCGRGSAPLGRLQDDDAGAASVAACQDQHEHLVKLYERAADEEAVPANLRGEFVESLVHMVMTDCVQDSPKFVGCLQQAASADEVESQCLLPLDDAGKAEGRRFASSP